MAKGAGTQTGTTRIMTTTDEIGNAALIQCPNCQVKTVPRGITSTRKNTVGEKHCPNCGHIFGRANH